MANNWDLIVDLSKVKQDRPNGYFELENPVRCTLYKYENVYMPTPNLAVSDIRVFGNGIGSVPDIPKNLIVVRDKDKRNAFIKWDKVPDAVGYNILWGIKKDKLYQTYQVWADQKEELELRALTVGQDYYFAIEAFNENGVSKDKRSCLYKMKMMVLTFKVWVVIFHLQTLKVLFITNQNSECNLFALSILVFRSFQFPMLVLLE